MSSDSKYSRVRPVGVIVNTIINGIGCLLTLLFWGVAAYSRLIPHPADVSGIPERANTATTWGFMIGDIAFSAPLLLLGTIGLWRLRAWGWTAAQMVNILWLYSMTVVWMRDAYTSLSPGGMVFLPFVPAAIWSMVYLWKKREIFWRETITKS